MPLDDGGEIGEMQIGPVFECDLRQIGRRPYRRNMLNADPLVWRVDETAGAWNGSFDKAQWRGPERVCCCFNHLQQRYARELQLLWVGQHLKLLFALPPYRDICDAWYTHEPRPDIPARQH